MKEGALVPTLRVGTQFPDAPASDDLAADVELSRIDWTRERLPIVFPRRAGC